MPRKTSPEEICSWVNTKLLDININSLSDLLDGVVFCRLVELFTGQSVKEAIPNPKTFDDKIINVGLAVSLIENHLRVRVEKVNVTSIAMGDINEITSLISFMILELEPTSSLCSGLETKAKKRKLSGAALEYSAPVAMPGKGPKICDVDNEKKKQKNGYFRWPVESTTEIITTNTLPIITLRKDIYSRFQYDVEVNEAPTMDDIDRVIEEETRLIDTSASIHQQEVDYKIATKMTIRELQTIGKKLVSQVSGIVVCDLSCNNISTFPNALLMGKSLEEINLSCNKLQSLPALEGPEVYLSSLTYLDLSLNPLTYLPTSLFHLPKLESLILSRCHLDSLDLPLEGVRPVGPSLRTLDLSHNNFAALPDGFGILRQLEVVNMSCNKLPAVPRALAELPGLAELWVSGNRIAELPKRVPSTLRILVANGNLIESVPREWELPQLSVLSLAHNRIAKLRSDFFERFPELTALDLSANRLTSLPRVTARKLAALRVAGNRLSELSIPQDVLAGLVVLDFSFNSFSSLPNLAGARALEILNASYNKLSGSAGTLRAGIPRTLVRLGLAGCDLGEFDWCDSVLSFPRLETLLLQGNNIKRAELGAIAASKSIKFADFSHNPFLQSAAGVNVLGNIFMRKVICCDTPAAPAAATTWGKACYSDPRAPGAGSYSLAAAVEGIAPGCALYALYDSCGFECKRVAGTVATAVAAAVRGGLPETKGVQAKVSALLASAIKGANRLFSDDPMEPIQGCSVLLVLVDSAASLAYTASLGSGAAAIVSSKSARWIAERLDPLGDAEYDRVHRADPRAFVTKDGRLMGIFAASRGLGCKLLGPALSTEPVVNVTNIGAVTQDSFIVMGSEKVWKMASLEEFVAPFVVESYKKTKGNADLTAACLRDWCLGSCADDYQNFNAVATLVVPLFK